MASEFITRVEHGKDEPYTVIFTTDDERKYKAIEDACRYAIGHGKPQFQEAVRCKECKHNIGEKVWLDGEVTIDCANGMGYPPPNWFCADGERKDGADDGRTD